MSVLDMVASWIKLSDFLCCTEFGFLSMQWPGLLEQLSNNPSLCREQPVKATQLVNYITHMCGGLGNTLFDSRRRTCHSLLLNYFCAGSGLVVLLQHLDLAIKLLAETSTMNVQSLSLDNRGMHLCPQSLHCSPTTLKSLPLWSCTTAAWKLLHDGDPVAVTHCCFLRTAAICLFSSIASSSMAIEYEAVLPV